MFDCHCQDTTGQYIRITPYKKLWICDFCKGNRMIRTQPAEKRIAVLDINYTFLLRRYQARLAER